MKRFLLGLMGVFTLVGCGVHDVKNVDGSKYNKVADYASDIIETSGCVGKVDDIFFPSGEKFRDNYGLNYISRNASLHCSKESFQNSLKKYCVNKGGYIKDENSSWCVINDTPLFYIGDFSTLEQDVTQSKNDWMKSAAKKGFVSEHQKIRDEMLSRDEEKKNEDRMIKEMNTPVIAEIGDLICKKDYEVKPYQYPGVVYYKAYVERKVKDKMQLRLVWHGGDGFVINDIAPPGNIIWSSTKGWKLCN